MTNAYIGVDIGLDGAISTINDNQQIMKILPMPVVKGKRAEYDIREIITFFQNTKLLFDACHVVIEKPIPRPIISCNSNFMLGGGLFLFEGICASLNIGYQIVTAKTWQKEILKGLSKDSKTASILFCKRKWSNVNLKKTTRSKKDHDGISDSLCIADYSYRINRGVVN